MQYVVRASAMLRKCRLTHVQSIYWVQPKVSSQFSSFMPISPLFLLEYFCIGVVLIGVRPTIFYRWFLSSFLVLAYLIQWIWMFPFSLLIIYFIFLIYLRFIHILLVSQQFFLFYVSYFTVAIYPSLEELILRWLFLRLRHSKQNKWISKLWIHSVDIEGRDSIWKLVNFDFQIELLTCISTSTFGSGRHSDGATNGHADLFDKVISASSRENLTSCNRADRAIVRTNDLYHNEKFQCISPSNEKGHRKMP